ncbi:MAG: ArsR/SmtB family transcription factor [Vicinamibacterales bacterium]
MRHIRKEDIAEVCDLVHIDPARVGRLRAALVDGADVEGLADTFRALGDPTRVRILDALSHGELCVCDLAAVLGVSQSAVSHQLRLLRGLRLVRSRRDGRMIFYALDDRHIITLFRQTLRHVQEAEPRRGDKPLGLSLPRARSRAR